MLANSCTKSRKKGTLGQALRPYFFFTVLTLCLLQISRVGLVAWQNERVTEAGGLGFLFLQGLRFDLVAIGLMLLAPGLFFSLLLGTRWTYRLGEFLMHSFLAAGFTLFFFLELSTPSFLEEYDCRPNYLFVEYLEFPKEVLSTLWGAYPWQLVMAAVAVPLTLILSYRLIARCGSLSGPLHPIKAVLLAAGLFLVSFAAARSSIGHRGVNPSTVCYSGDAMVNTLPLSSLYTVSFDVYEKRKHERSRDSPYGRMPYEEVLEVVRADSGHPPSAFTSTDIPTLHHQKSAHPRGRPLNLVIVLEESLGAEFVGAMGGLPLTPHLDQLLGEGFCLDNLYATGTRSARGIEAVVTGFLPTPARSIVKLPRAQRDFFTIAELLRREGYATSFMYGGDAHFDNMARFFTGNGFQEVLERKDFPNPTFEGSWGVSDQDLFRRAHAEFEGFGDKPFFSLVFSSSNHSPWEFPAGSIELYEEPAATRNNAVKYADQALGEFFELARESSYWENTLFLVVADHNSRVYGSALVPVERFHIPAVFLGGAISSSHVSTLASQVDLLPTALSLMGLDSTHPALGRDLSDPAQRTRPGRAFLQFYQTALLLEDERALMLRSDFPPTLFTVVESELVPKHERDPEFERRALAHALWPQISYHAGDYRMP